MKNFLETKTAKTIYFIAGLVIISLVMTYVYANSKLTGIITVPKITFQDDKHDFGKVPQGPQLQFNFKFTNSGAETLVIDHVQTSCGCTGATTGEKKEYSKNENGELTVTFNTQGREGHQEKVITVFSNDPEEPQKMLTITCDIDKAMQ
jgi:hypothetical protein